MSGTSDRQNNITLVYYHQILVEARYGISGGGDPSPPSLSSSSFGSNIVVVLLVAGSAWAQTATLQGDVKDQNGQPLKGAVIVLDRTDMKGHYTVKSEKKGHWLYTGLPGAATFDISCTVDGKVME